MAKCAWGDCTENVEDESAAYVVGKPPHVATVQLCLKHQDEWSEMVAAARGAELQAQVFKGAPTYIVTHEDPFNAGSNLPSRYGPTNDLEDALAKGKRWSTEAGEIRPEFDGCEARVWSGVIDPEMGPRLETVVARFRGGERTG
ncbi:MAG TPA: hypothetical protein VGC71_15845 [Gaiellales bacterium]